MRIAVVAAGGVGGFLGVRLAQAGHEVAVMARGAHLAAIRADGLTLETDDGTTTVRPQIATDRADAIGPADVVVFAVKHGDTDAAAESCRALIGPDTVVVPFQNGVEATVRLAAILGPAHVAAGLCYIAVHIAAPGRIRKTGALERFHFAEADGSASPRIEALRDALVDAGVRADIPDDIAVETWRKFAFLAPMSGLTAASRSPIGVIRADTAMRAAFERAVREVVAVAQAQGVALPDGVVEQHMRFIDTLSPEMTASQAHDLAAGKPLEVEGLSGAVARLGAAAGLDTPVHATLLAVLRPFAEGAPKH